MNQRKLVYEALARGGRVIFKISNDELVRLYVDKEWPCHKIAKVAGVSDGTMLKRLRSLGVKDGWIYPYGYHRISPNPGEAVYEHRHKLGIPKGDPRIVHHIDGNKSNNNVANLKVFANHADHTRHHGAEARLAFVRRTLSEITAEAA